MAGRSAVAGIRWIKGGVFCLALLPFCYLLWSVLTGNAGANPIETVEKSTGEWTLRFLLLSLLATPLSRWFKWVWPVRVRRMIGLFTFFYACTHLLAYVWLDHSLVWRDIWLEIIEKPFITAGFSAFLILLPLAITSNRYAVKILGSRWKALHSWVYFAAVLAVLHYIWLAKGDRLEPIVYLTILLLLLLVRAPALLKGR